MASELKKLILDFEDIPEEKVVVPQWGDVEILVRGMTGKDRANFLKRSSNTQTGEVDFEKFYPELIIATAHDLNGEKIFEGADRDAINAKSGAALESIARVAQRLSGLGAEDLESAKKDSAETENSAST